MTAPAVRILAVCTGNISRSPAVERLLAAGLGDSAAVSSAGVAAVVGAPIDPPVAAYLRAGNVETAGFAARQVTEAMLRESDLILALTRQHRARCLDLAPAAVRRTFTLLEFARVLESVDLPVPTAGTTPGQRLREILPTVSAGRSLAPRRPAAEDDVPDPFGWSPEVYDASLAAIQAATDSILWRLRVAEDPPR